MEESPHIERLPVEVRLMIYDQLFVFEEININRFAVARPSSPVRTYASLRATSRLFRDEVTGHVRSHSVAVYHDKDEMLFTLEQPMFKDLVSQFSKVTMQFTIDEFATTLFCGRHSWLKWWSGEYPARFYETYHFEESNLTLALDCMTRLESLRLAFPDCEATLIADNPGSEFHKRLLADLKRCSSAEWLLRQPLVGELEIVLDYDHNKSIHHADVNPLRRPPAPWGGE